MSKRANKNDNRSVEEDDDDEDIPEEYLHNTQDNSERLRIRKGYRTLIEDLHSLSFLFIPPHPHFHITFTVYMCICKFCVCQTYMRVHVRGETKVWK